MVSKAVELGALALFWVTMIFGIVGAGTLVRDHLRGTLAVDAIFYIRLHMTVTVLRVRLLGDGRGPAARVGSHRACAA